jgi:PAS domain S-box-containing protein
MRIGRSIAVLSIALALGSRSARALDPDTRITQYRHSAWRVQDGAFESAPNVVAQTADGYIWIGTGSGLVKYDGVRFAPWTPPPGKSLANPSVLSLLGSPDGTLWIGSASGLFSLKNEDLLEHLQHRINGIIQDRKGRIWVARARNTEPGGLCQVTGEHPGCIGGDDRMKLPHAASIAEDVHGDLWAGGAGVLLRWNEGSFDTYFREQLASRNLTTGVESIAAASDGSVWAAVPGEKSLALVHIVDGRPRPVVLPGVETQSFETLFIDREGSLWLGSSDKGLYRLNGGRVDHFGREDGLSSNTVVGLFEDREGNLWVATSRGLDSFRDSRVITFTASEGLSSDHVESVLAAKDGTVWIGNKGSLDAFRDGRITSVPIPGKRVTALFQDHAGRLWVGIDGMLTILEQGRFRKVNRPDGSPLGITTAVAEDRDQNIWAIANPDKKLFRIRDLRVQEEFDAPRMPISRTVAADPSGGVWLGFMDSVGHYRDGKLDVIPTNGAPNLAVEADGSLWAATRGGLVRWKDGRAETLTSRNGLPCDPIYEVIHDDKATLWLSATCGLIGIADSELQRWWQDPRAVIQAQLLDALDGAMPRKNIFHPGVTRSPDGRLWFANDAGVQLLDPNRPGHTGPAPPVLVEQVRADRKDYGPPGPVRLPPNTRDIEISYTALSYSIPERVRFRYKLDGRDRDWQDVGTRRQAFYSDLPPGKYGFHVSASNGDGIWSENGDAVEFSIAPAYYQTTWFRALGAAVVIALLGAAYRFRLWQVERESRRLRDVIETIPAHVWSALPDGTVDFVNRRWLEFTGFSLDRALGWGWTDALHPEDRARFVEGWRAAIRSGDAMEAEARMRSADGQYRWLLFRTVPLRDPSGRIVKWYGKSTDIEDRKRSEQERERLHELEADLAHINRVSTMGELTASIAHEVNQPLSGVVSNGGACLRWLDGDVPDLEEAREAARRIVRDGKRAGEVIARIRSLTKREATPREKLDLNKTIREVLDLVGDKARKEGVTIRTQFDRDLARVLGDRVQSQQVLLNLVMNGIEALSSVKTRARDLFITTRNIDMDQVQVTVRDSGPGIDPDAIEKIFGPFYTTKPDGMGMGLSICRSILQNHGGRLWAAANEGPGTSFHFTVPRYREEESHSSSD